MLNNAQFILENKIKMMAQRKELKAEEEYSFI